MHHYEDANGIVTDIDPYSAPPGILNPITYLDRYIQANDDLRRIKVIKPTAIEQIVKAYNESLRTA